MGQLLYAKQFYTSMLIMALLCAITLAVVLLSYRTCIRALLAVLHANGSCRNLTSVAVEGEFWRGTGPTPNNPAEGQQDTVESAHESHGGLCGLQRRRDCGFCKFLAHFGSRMLARERGGARIEIMPHDIII